MLKISNLFYSSENKPILNDISLTIHEGECVALLGPNGAGKSTLVDAITGAIKPSKGNVLVSNKEFSNVKRDVGVLFEYPPLFYYSKVKEIIYYVSTIYGIPYNEIIALEKILGIDQIRSSNIRSLSKGERKKLGILLSLLHNPKLLILDEPTSDMDPFFRDDVWKLFKKNNRTIFFTSHLWEEAEKYSDRIVFIDGGEVLSIDTPSSFLSDKYIRGAKKIVIAKHNNDKLLSILADIPFVEDDDNIYLFTLNIEKFTEEHKTYLNNYSITSKDLKDIFLFLRKSRKEVLHG